MNRLIIIGNGFDLAHGIKTSYKDFILTYLTNAVNSFYNHNQYEDKLIKIQFKGGLSYGFYETPKPVTTEDVLECFENLQKNKNFNIILKSLLLEITLAQISNMNWVDIETEYFNVLVATKQSFKKDNQQEAIQIINAQLDYLKEKLIEYLINQEKSFENNFDRENLVNCFTENIQPTEIVTVKVTEPQKPQNLYFLNFNYTKTFEIYFQTCKNLIASEFNYIHGNLLNTNGNGNPIFGFGDEFDKKYLEFEEENNNELFKHIKSFEYLKSSNYYRLIRFIESNEFQVHIYGHSCGLSDRTMLNEIFEHKNCKSIKIFYHQREDQTNDYTEKTYEISRHFKDKALMRKKIVPFVLSKFMPQPEKKNILLDSFNNQN